MAIEKIIGVRDEDMGVIQSILKLSREEKILLRGLILGLKMSRKSDEKTADKKVE